MVAKAKYFYYELSLEPISLISIDSNFLKDYNTLVLDYINLTSFIFPLTLSIEQRVE